MTQNDAPNPLKSSPVKVDLKVETLETALYVVATPIGNLDDITLRALKVLMSADRIACEDTRVTGKLLNRYGIKARMVSYHDHNAAQQLPVILSQLEKGGSVALVSDAGTPLISDPGYRLVNDVREAGFKVIPVPGVSSPITALSASGLPTDRFYFEGFLPTKAQARSTRLKELVAIPSTLVFLESAKRLSATLLACAQSLGGTREAVVARELTKIYETFHRGHLQELAAHFEKAGAPKGEIVLVIGPAQAALWDDATVEARLADLLKTHHLKAASERAAKESGLSKRDLYQRALKLKAREGG